MGRARQAVNRRASALQLFAVLATTACARTQARVSVAYHGSLSPASLAVTIEDGKRTIILGGRDLEDGRPHTFSTGQRGTLRIGFRFADTIGVVSAGEIAMPLTKDNAYDVLILVDSLDTCRDRQCFGWQRTQTFPLATRLRRSIKDSVRVLWTSNSISNPVTYSPAASK